MPQETGPAFRLTRREFIAGAGALDFDDVGAEIGEQLAGPRTGQNPGQLQHTQTSQRTRHETLPTSRGHAPHGILSGAVARICPGGRSGSRHSIGMAAFTCARCRTAALTRLVYNVTHRQLVIAVGDH